MVNKISDRNQYAFNKILQINNNMIFSGECQFCLSFKLVGITRFSNIIKHSEYYKVFNEDCTKFNNVKKLYLSLVVKFTYGDQVLKWTKFSPIVIYDKIFLNYTV